MFASYLPPSVFYASSEQNGIIIHPYEPQSQKGKGGDEVAVNR